LFATIVDYMLALEFDKLDESRMLTVHRCWKWAHSSGLTAVSNYFLDVWPDCRVVSLVSPC
jgi:hypothetical protein